jgi:uncharacterized RDD family membrane protein YckC
MLVPRGATVAGGDPLFHLSSEPSQQDEDYVLASRWSRLGSAIIDGLVIAALLLPAQWQVGVFDGFPYMEDQELVEILVWGAIGFVTTLIVHGYLLATRAQSIGKFLFGIKIVNVSGGNASFSRIVLLRMLPVSVAGLIPIIGGFLTLVDVLYIFRFDKRCVHDHIAETRVVRAR